MDDLKVDYVDSFVIHWPQAVPATGKSALLAKHGNDPAHVSKGECWSPFVLFLPP